MCLYQFSFPLKAIQSSMIPSEVQCPCLTTEHTQDEEITTHAVCINKGTVTH